MKFKVGERVRAIDEAAEGTIEAIDGNTCFVNIDGLAIPYETEELVRVEYDELITPHLNKKLKPKERAIEDRARNHLKGLTSADDATYELDLHIHALLDHFEHMTNGEILQHQMLRCRAFIHEALDKRFPKVVIIHGVGEGVLKSEVHRFLDQQDHITYHDAPYRTYGFGATEVMIHR